MGCLKAKKNGWKRKAGTALIIFGAVCVLALVFIESFIRPTLMKLLDYKLSTAAERIISDAVFEQFSDSGIGGDIVNLTFDSEGRVAALSTDRAKINTLKALLNEAANDGVERLGSETVSISLGTLTGISFLYGAGTSLRFRIEPKGKTDTKLTSTFKSSGINQTIHSIILEVDTELSPMMPGFDETIDVSCDILLAQTVIVGRVPESYSYIVLDEEHLSEIADIDI